MCFHWCSACGMLQTGMGKEKQQKAFFSFFNSILPVRRFSVGVYSFISSVCLRPVRPAMPALLLRSGRTGPQRLALSFTPPSLARSLLPSLPPLLSLSLSCRFCGKIVTAHCSPSSFLPLCDTDTLLCAPCIYFSPICLFSPSS